MTQKMTLDLFAKNLADLVAQAQKDRVQWDQLCRVLELQITNVKMWRARTTPVA